MALIKTHCNTCGSDFNLDVGDMTNEEVQKNLEKRDSFHCDAGHHMELNSPAKHWIIGERIEGSAPSEAEWFKTMTERYGKLYSNDEVAEHFEITGFCFGSCMAKRRVTGEEVCLSFIHSPKSVRYYHE